MQDELRGAPAQCIGGHCARLKDLIRLTATCRAFAGSCDVPTAAAITLQRWWRSRDAGAGRRERLAGTCLEMYECIIYHDGFVPFWMTVINAAAGQRTAFWYRYMNSAMYADPADAATFISAKNIANIAFYTASKPLWFRRIVSETAHGSDDLPRLIATAFSLEQHCLSPFCPWAKDDPFWRHGYRSLYHAIEHRVGFEQHPGAFEQPAQWTTGFFFDEEEDRSQSPLALVLDCFTYMIRDDPHEVGSRLAVACDCAEVLGALKAACVASGAWVTHDAFEPYMDAVDAVPGLLANASSRESLIA